MKKLTYTQPVVATVTVGETSHLLANTKLTGSGDVNIGNGGEDNTGLEGEAKWFYYKSWDVDDVAINADAEDSAW